MTDEVKTTRQKVKELKEFLKRFPNPPHPEHEPKRFAWHVKMFRYYKSKGVL